ASGDRDSCCGKHSYERRRDTARAVPRPAAERRPAPAAETQGAEMKIISLVAENVKKLVAIEIRPDGNLVVISGKNAAGKTSVLDSIWWCLAGATHIQAAPIRKGSNEARIRLDLGELRVTRTFKRGSDGTGPTTSITVENAEGARFPSPQRMLDSLIGALSFDPLEFARMPPAEQFDALRRFVPEVDFVAIENADRGDRERRTELGRQARQERAAAEAIKTPAETPEVEIDEAALVAELETAGAANAELEVRKARRERAEADVLTHQQSAQRWRAEADKLRQQAAAAEERAREMEKAAEELQRKLNEAPPLPAPTDTAAIREHIAAARKINAHVRALDERMKHHTRAMALEQQLAELTSSISRRQEAKAAAIAAAKMPVPGLGFGDHAVLMDGLPFEQASDAEQLRVSVAIAIALNPKLRVLRVRDGSLLAETSLTLLARMADENDMQ